MRQISASFLASFEEVVRKTNEIQLNLDFYPLREA
jgi:hypothetical protein